MNEDTEYWMDYYELPDDDLAEYEDTGQLQNARYYPDDAYNEFYKIGTK